MDNTTYQLSLLITERCNLRCSYCYCDKRRESTMTIETAKQAIDEAKVAIGDSQLRLLLMGGEPFMEFDLICQIVDYVRTNYHDHQVIVKTVTNGTLVHGAVQQWLTENKDIFHTCLSLDGSREVHNRNRCGSYDKIDIRFFLRTYGANAEVNMVACPENMDQLASSVIKLHEQGFRVKCVLADDCHWDSSRDPDRWAKQLAILSEYYLQHPEFMPFSQLCESLNYVGNHTVPEICQPDHNMHCIDTQGVRYGCHRCTPYFNNGAWYIMPKDISLMEYKVIHDECYRCPAQIICCSCPALVASLQYDARLGAAMCAMFQVTHKANAALIARMFVECPEHIRIRQMNNATKRDFIIGAQMILNDLKI